MQQLVDEFLDIDNFLLWPLDRSAMGGYGSAESGE
jgi:hypothetical protein